MTVNKPKLEFAPGCFDDFTGTQAELDELVAEITRLFESGELLENGVPVDLSQYDFDIEGEVSSVQTINNTRH